MAVVFIERMMASLSAMEAHLGMSSLKCTPGMAVGIDLKGPLVGVPGFGSHVSNWLGPPQSQSRMQRFCFRLAVSAKAGLEKRPDQLKVEMAPAVIPSRKRRR